MLFKLLRIDGEKQYKLELAVGKHLIGRGNFLHNDDSDKRVSRNHAELEVTTHSVTLKSLHKNPCFYIKCNTTETQILQQDCDVSLNNGDKFGLIPDHFWYELIHIEEDQDQTALTINNNINHEIDNKNMKERVEEDGVSQDKTEAQTDIDQQSKQEYDPAKVASSDNPNSPVKRTHSIDSPEGVDLKKVKTEPDETGDARPGPSNDQAVSSDASKDSIPASPQKPVNNGPLRERCWYGANCYRKNEQHKAQFSHPSDSDWGAGERIECPWGAACRRREPRHWRDHCHPPAAQPPGMQVVERHGNVFYINAHTVNFHDDYFDVEDSDGNSVDYDYEF